MREKHRASFIAAVSAVLAIGPATSLGQTGSATVAIDENVYCGGPAIPADEEPLPATRRTGPQYPRSALRREQEGYAVVRIRVSEEGKIVAVEPIWESSGLGFADALERGIKAWKFLPHRPGLVCFSAAFLFSRSDKYPTPPSEDPDVPEAPDAISSSFALTPGQWPDQDCEATVDVILGEGGVPIATVQIGTPSTDERCEAAAAQIVWSWRFPPDTHVGRYRLTIAVKRPGAK